MEIIKAYPPNYEAIKNAFDIENEKVVFCYGNKLYNPLDLKISEELIAHELVHVKQQGDDPEGWWNRYIADPDFRLSQEVEAYGVQYKFVKQMDVTTKAKEKFLGEIAAHLSSKIYGNIISYGQAVSKIRHAADK